MLYLAAEEHEICVMEDKTAHHFRVDTFCWFCNFCVRNDHPKRTLRSLFQTLEGDLV